MQLEKEFYTTTEMAVIFGVTEYTIRRWIKTKKLGAIKPGGEWRIPHDEYKKLVNQMYGGDQ